MTAFGFLPPPLVASGLLLVASGLLLLICWQDWRTRSVSWPTFPLLAGSLLTSRLLCEPPLLVGWESSGSLLIIGLLLGILWLYVRLRLAGRRLRDCLGSGDILFWLAAAGYLPPAQLLLFLLGSSLVSLLLVAAGSLRLRAGETTVTIPLAGIQAACLLLLLTGQWLFPAGAARLAASLPPVTLF